MSSTVVVRGFTSGWLTLLSGRHRTRRQQQAISCLFDVIENKTIFQSRTQSHVFLLRLVLVLDHAG